jgi:hypothetical protein
MTQTDSVFTIKDTVYFDSYSIIELEGAVFKWDFNPTPQWISSLESRNPKVVFGEAGSYDVSLEITDKHGKSDKATINSMVTLLDLSRTEPIAGKALKCTSAGDYASTGDFNISAEVLSITAWVKPEGIQPDYSGIVINNGETAGINFRGGNNTLGYHWPGGSWSWNSNLIVKPYQWSHVAIVADRDRVTLYVNGFGETHVTDIDPALITGLRIGSYKGWASRNFNGSIDEVQVWKKALSEEEIRLNMHLTIEDETDHADLIAYYQFNEPAGPVINKAGSTHASMYGNSHRSVSYAPIGQGKSSMIEVSSGGEYGFANTGIVLTFPHSGILPDGKLVVSKLNTLPAVLPNENPNSGSYWIIDGYGSNYFSSLSSARFTLDEKLSGEIFDNSRHAKLWNRRPDSDQNTWVELCGARSAGDKSDSTLSYDASCQISGYGHYIIISDDPDIPLYQSQTTAINSYKAMAAPIVFPNPVTKGNNIRIKTNYPGKVRFSLYGLDGKLISDRILRDSDSYSIDTGGMKKGIYLLSIITDKYVYNRKIVIE